MFDTLAYKCIAYCCICLYASYNDAFTHSFMFLLYSDLATLARKNRVAYDAPLPAVVSCLNHTFLGEHSGVLSVCLSVCMSAIIRFHLCGGEETFGHLFSLLSFWQRQIFSGLLKICSTFCSFEANREACSFKAFIWTVV